MNKNFFYLTPILFLLAGCSSPQKPLQVSYITTNSAPVAAVDIHAQAQLAQAAQSIDNSLNNLSAIEMASHPKAHLPHLLNAQNVDMTQIASLQWTGPIEPLLTKISAATNYQFKVVGSAPNPPLIVAINTHNKPIVAIVNDAILQLKKHATIRVNPTTRVIELDYL